MAVAFTDPDIAVIGSGFNPEDEEGQVAGSSNENGRARIDGASAGLFCLYARPSDNILTGAELFGVDAEHLAHLVAWAVQMKLTVDQCLDLPFYHPTVEEGLRTALRDLKKNLDASKKNVKSNQ